MNKEQLNMRISHRDKDKYKQYADNIQGYEVDASSIQRVPCVQITQDKNLNNLIQVLHKKLLYETLIRSDGHKFDEVGCLLELVEPYKNTNMIYGYYDNAKGISSINAYKSTEYKEYITNHQTEQLLFMHTHPNNSKLSFGDILNLIMTDQLYAVTAVGNSGIIHIAYKDKTFNSADLKRRLFRFNNKLRGLSEIDINKRKHQLMSRLESEQSKYGIIFKTSYKRRY